jgi:ppGpp synthetase/RelA/SpoT-type nucleotidyltranferase
MESNYRHITEALRKEVEDKINQVALLCRVFARGKSDSSLNIKLLKNPNKYIKNGKSIQDAIGIRIALYFAEDIDIVSQLLTAHYKLAPSSSTIDLPNLDTFTVSRHNLIFEIPEIHLQDMNRVIGNSPIEPTFEVQLRSILSEGWHEVDHDLRYKSKSYWDDQNDLGRALNGILATLETAEWSMKKIFDDLAYRHYKNRSWTAMLHVKFRMRIEPKLSIDITSILDDDIFLAKDIFRINRNTIIKVFARLSPHLPITLDNIFYVSNFVGPKSPVVLDVTPVVVMETLQNNY